MSPRLRCAIYTRKSSEEGLDQNFNSLHAQREACEAYILSQTGEGWTASRAQYDDGGFSGGSMERPGLKRLMADIAEGHVDIVVVYKVDRLTRSLADFAKIVELFDGRGVSFVSVTQAFNTTSSMGRLTLNVLLSFAQFEREVTSERIRDKIAASKAKGIRTGGRPPLGYDVIDGRLQPNEGEAATVREIYRRYLATRSVDEVQRSLQTDSIAGKRWTNRAGEVVGGGYLAKGALYYLLSNPIYVGTTRHKDKLHPNTHAPIIDQQTWDSVQKALSSTNASQPATELRGEPARLKGLLFDDRGNPMIPVHTAQGGKRYRYYVSMPKVTGKGQAGSIHRVSAGVIEQFLSERVAPLLASDWMPDAPSIERAMGSLRRIVIGSDQLLLDLDAGAVSVSARDPNLSRSAAGWRIALGFHMRRRQGALILEGDRQASKPAGQIDRPLIRAVVLARLWAKQLESGEADSVKALAAANGLCEHYTARLLPLAYLAPDLTQAILEGRQPRAASLAALTAANLPFAWGEQRRLVQRLG